MRDCMVIWKNREAQRAHLIRISKLGTEKIRANPKLCSYGGRARCKKLTIKEQSENGKLSRIHENMVAKLLLSEYDKMYYPQEVCDRIGIKNGEIFFIEIKQKGRKLTNKQEEFQKIANNRFILKID